MGHDTSAGLPHAEQSARTGTMGAEAPASAAGRCGGRGEAIHRPGRHDGFDGGPKCAHNRRRVDGHDKNLGLRGGGERGRVATAETIAGAVVLVGLVAWCRGRSAWVGHGVIVPHHLPARLARRRCRLDHGRRAGVQPCQQQPAHTRGKQQQECGESAEWATSRDHAGEINSLPAGREFGGVRRLTRAASSRISTVANAIGVEVSSFTSQR